MKQCDTTVVVYNAQFNASLDRDVYTGTVIAGVSWFSDIAATVDGSGLKAAKKVTVRIPVDAECTKSYTTPIAYKTAAASKSYTLQAGDIVVQGDTALVDPKPSDIQKANTEVFTVLAVTDNTKRPNAKHWKLVGA